MPKELTESLEKYLLAIFELLNQKENIKVKDVSAYLKIGGPATADAIKTLAARGFINYVPYGTISLTSKGASAAELKRYRHRTISQFLNNKFKIINIVYNITRGVIQWTMKILIWDHIIYI